MVDKDGARDTPLMPIKQPQLAPVRAWGPPGVYTPSRSQALPGPLQALTARTAAILTIIVVIVSPKPA